MNSFRRFLPATVGIPRTARSSTACQPSLHIRQRRARSNRADLSGRMGLPDRRFFLFSTRRLDIRPQGLFLLEGERCSSSLSAVATEGFVVSFICRDDKIKSLKLTRHNLRTSKTGDKLPELTHPATQQQLFLAPWHFHYLSNICRNFSHLNC